MSLDFTKSMSDPIYGTMPLTKLELQIIDTPVFQRLRQVGQLGLASYVFPSADYSRFAHSIGACHTMGQLLDRLESLKLPKKRLPAEEFQLRRVAMLLHDVGHYFMSHAAEHALEQQAEKQKSTLVKPGSKIISAPKAPGYYDHEDLGKVVLDCDPDLSRILAQQGWSADMLASMFKGASDRTYGSLVSSELDADRLDYLMRSSQATGLPYGHFDRDYILQNLRLSKDGRVCLDPKAVRAADHYVMCRSFDYLQVVFHKTIVGFEEMLKHCLMYLLETKQLKMEKPQIKKLIQDRNWVKWTDAFLMEQIRSIPHSATPPILAMRDRLVSRTPARLVWMDEEIINLAKDQSQAHWHRELGHVFDSGGPDWTKNCIYWYKHFRPTDASPFQTTYKRGQKDDEYREKSIQILQKDDSLKPLTDCKESFTRHLSNQAYVMVRVYFVGPERERTATESEFRTLMKRLMFNTGFRN